jgi:hypothetical protein
MTIADQKIPDRRHPRFPVFKQGIFAVFVLAALLTLLVAVPLGPAYAAGTPITAGDFTIAATNDSDPDPVADTDYTYASNVLTILSDKAMTIAMASPGATSTADRIVISTGAVANEANITLDNVKINVTSCALLVNASTLNLTLKGTNSLTSGLRTAGLMLQANANLVITEDSDGASLEATCSNDNGAGIGTGEYGASAGGNITINGGNITATGGPGISGAGGSGIGATNKNCGDITINGGTVIAQGRGQGTGIGSGGSGPRGTCENILITGGTVTASSGGRSAAIGGGGATHCGNITITGGTVTATALTGSDVRAASIGSGTYNGYCGDILITGGTVTTNSDIGTVIGNTNSGGSSARSVTITGGSVFAAAHVTPAPMNALSGGVAVYANTLSFSPAVGNGAAISSGSIAGISCADTPDAAAGVYGIKEVKTNASGQICFWLPERSDVTRVKLNIPGSVSTYQNYQAFYARPPAAYSGTLRPDIPSAPRNLITDLGGASVTLSWEAPEYWQAPAADAESEVMKYQAEKDSEGWTDVPDGVNARSYTYTGLTNGTAHTFKVRAVNANGNGMEAAAATYRWVAPTAVIDYANETLTGLEAGGTYAFNGGSAVTLSGTAYDIPEAWMTGSALTIVRKGSGGVSDSLPQSLTIPARPAAPEGISAAAEVFAGEGGKLTSVTDQMEYKSADASSWTSAPGGEIQGLEPGEYDVRLQAVADTGFHSGAAEVTIAAGSDYKLKTQVSADPDGVNGKSDTKYLLVTFEHLYPANNGVPIAGLTAALSNTAQGVWVAGAANIGTVSDNGDDTDRTWRVNIYQAQNNGTATLTFKPWTAANGNTYTVTSTTPSPASVTVYKAVPEQAPDATVDYENERLTDLTAGEKYKINGAERTADGSGYIPLGEFIPPANETDAERSLNLVKSGGAASVDSPAQQLTIPARLPAPDITPVQPASSVETTGSITGVDTTMEYQKAGDGPNWMTCGGTTLDSLAPSAYYYVRFAATGADFHSDSAAAYIHAYNEIDFGSVFEGYGGPIASKPIEGDSENITAVEWDDPGDTVNNSAFELPVGSPWEIAPKPDLDPGDYSAAIKLTYSDATPASTQNVTFRVHKRAEITNIEQTGTDAKGATEKIKITFAHDIALNWSGLSVSGGAVKSGTDFAETSSNTYTLNVTPQMDHKDGDAVTVSVNLHSTNFGGSYDYQASRPGDAALASAQTTVTIPRAIAGAEAVTPIPGYSTGYIQFTLDPMKNSIDTDAIEKAINEARDPGAVEIKIDGALITPEYIYRVDAGMGYTFRLRISPDASGDNVTLALPGFGITEPFTVTGGVSATGKTLTGNAFFLSENGSNYLTGIGDARQVLPSVNLSGGQAPIYEAPALELRVNQEYGDWTVSEFYLDDEMYSGYTTMAGGPLNQIFDGVPDDPSYPDLTNYLQITLPAGWARGDGTYMIHAVLTNGGESVLLFAKIKIEGMTPAYTLTVTGGTGTGRYPAGAVVPIAGELPNSNMLFLRWTQAAQPGDAGYIAALPANISGTVTMPAGDAALTATYTRFPSGGGGGGGSANKPDADKQPADEQNGAEAEEESAVQSGAGLPFLDVRESDWFYGDVAYTYGKGLMLGTSETLFSPGLQTTRGMIVTILGRHYGINPDEYQGVSFADVDVSQYYAPYIKWAEENGIVFGVGDDRFAPGDYITREQFAAVLFRYYEWQVHNGGLPDVAPRVDENLSGYTDAAQISGWADEPMKWAHTNGLIIGRTVTELVPQGTATRAEAAALLHRFAEKFN